MGRRITCTECGKRRVGDVICDQCEEAIWRNYCAARSRKLQEEDMRRAQAAKDYNDRMWPGDPNRYLGTALEGREKVD